MGELSVLAVLGDSVATSLGLAESKGHWPSVIRGSRPGLRIVSFAKVAGQINQSAARIDEVINAMPTAVIVAHGGRECLMRTTTALRLIKTDPRLPARLNARGIVRSVRRTLYRRVLDELTHERPRLLTAFIRLRPNLDAARFAELLDEIMDGILHRTTAPIIVLIPRGHSMGFHPWSTAAVAAVHECLRAWDQHDDRVTVVDMGVDFEEDPTAYQLDGVHLSLLGHRRVAVTLLEALARAEAAPAPTDSP